MSRTFWIVLRVGLACFATSLLNPTNAGERQPNFVFILCDDLGWGDFGVLHQNISTHDRRHQTPMIDRMAAEGMQLRAHYCNAPVCAPSRASLLSGVHQGHAEVRDNQFDKALADNHTLGSVLRRAGYQTVMIGKYGLPGEGETADQWPAYPTKRGFDEFYGYVRHADGHVHYPADSWPLGNSASHRSPKEVWHNDQEVSAGLSRCYTTDLFTARGKQWMIDQTRKNPDQPFLMYLAYDTPHAALQLPTMTYPEGGGLSGGLQWIGKPGEMINTARGDIDSYRHPDYTDQGWSDVEVRFASMIRRIDDCVGDLLQTIRDLGIDRDTIVVISSDNGPLNVSYIPDAPIEASAFQSYGPFDGIKRDVWEGGIRMASIAWGPGYIPADTIDDHPSQFHDWLATFADFAGLIPPARSDGVSLKPTLTGKGKQPPSQIYVEYFNRGKTPSYRDFDSEKRARKRGQMQVVHLEGYKGVRVNIDSHDDPFEIYDLAGDAKERVNLAGSSMRFKLLGQQMKDAVLRNRRPNPSAPRPYDEEMIPAVEVNELMRGLRWRSVRGDFFYVPNLRHVAADATGTIASLNSSDFPNAQGAVELTGWINIPTDGVYDFTIRSDTRAFLRIHEASVLDCDHGYQPKLPRTASIRLAQGLHPIRLTCLVYGGTPNLVLQWQMPDAGESTPIPAHVWFRH